MTAVLVREVVDAEELKNYCNLPRASDIHETYRRTDVDLAIVFQIAFGNHELGVADRNCVDYYQNGEAAEPEAV